MKNSNDTIKRQSITKVMIVLVIILGMLNAMTSCVSSQQMYVEKFHKQYPCPTFKSKINKFDI